MDGQNTQQRAVQTPYGNGQGTQQRSPQGQYGNNQSTQQRTPQAAYSSGQPKPAAQGKKPSSQDALLYILKNASWVSGEYKEQAHEDESLDFLRELYLCSQDDVPIERIVEARKTAAPAQSLRAYRNRCLEDRILSRQIKRLDDQVDRIDALETNVSRMQEIITNIKEIQSNMQGNTDEPQMPGVREMQMPGTEETKNPGTAEIQKSAKDNPQADISEMQRQVEVLQNQLNKNQNEKPENGLRHFFARLFSAEESKETLEEQTQKDAAPVRRDQKRNVADWVSRLMKKEGYDVAQADWITDCLQAGDTPEELMRFIRPNLSVEMMKKLRSYYYPDRPQVRNSSPDIPGFTESKRAESAVIRRTENPTRTAERGAGNYGRR